MMPSLHATNPLLKPSKFFILQAILLFQVQAQAVRFRHGCYNAHPVSCDVEVTPLEEIDFDLQQVCTRIEEEIFEGVNFVIYHPSSHGPYLNEVEPESEWCSLIHQAYRHCSFCGAGGANSRTFQSDCRQNTFVTKCGDQPTLSEVLMDNEAYPQFQIKQDIDDTCAELIQLYNYAEYGYPQQFPKTIDLCEKQHQVKHLCSGYCEGGCFDAKNHPPSCDSNPPLEAIGSVNVTTQDVCSAMRMQVFGALTNEELLDLSLHAEYLLDVSEDHPNCPLYREAYSHCSWCLDTDAICFDKFEPPSCETPKDDPSLAYDDQEVDRICDDIYSALPFFHNPFDVYDIHWHTNFLSIPEDTTLCEEAKHVYHRCVWCEENAGDAPCLHEESCHLDPEVPDSEITQIKRTLNITGEPTMEECTEVVFSHWVDNILQPVTQSRCNAHLAVRKMCPDTFCQDDPKTDSPNYLGTTTTLQRKALIWASRFSAILSFSGASFILYDIMSNKAGSGQTVFHSLLIGMAIFDIITAIAWGFATAPIDKEQSGYIEGAVGTEATCTAQAFFIQLGFASVFYNVSLAVYYVLVIAHGWKEFQLKKLQVYMHAIPVTVGLGLALGAIPSYNFFEYGCHLLPQPDGDLWVVLVFVVIPLGLSIVAITGSMITVYVKVKQRTTASRKWSFGIGQANTMEQAVFWQCLFYTIVFYITWPILFSVYLASVDVNGPLGLTMTVAFVAPLQGFNNFLVYIRPKFKKQDNRPSQTRRSSFVARMYASMRQAARASHGNANSATEKQLRLDPTSALAQEGCAMQTKRPKEPMPVEVDETECTTLEGNQCVDLAIAA